MCFESTRRLVVRGPAKVHLTFDQGTLLLDPPELPGGQEPPDCFRPDPRLGGRQRAPAIQYRRALASLVRAGVEVDDQARGYEELELKLRMEREPFPHQAEALEAWIAARRRGDSPSELEELEPGSASGREDVRSPPRRTTGRF